MTVLRTFSCVVALNATMAPLSTTVQAADETLTLACQGTASMSGIGAVQSLWASLST
jgi:hypothetical protein